MIRRQFLVKSLGFLALPLVSLLKTDEVRSEEPVWDTDYLYACVNGDSNKLHPEFLKVNNLPHSQNCVSRRDMINPYLNGKPAYMVQSANAETGEMVIVVPGGTQTIYGKVQLFVANKGYKTSKPKHYEEWVQNV